MMILSKVVTTPSMRGENYHTDKLPNVHTTESSTVSSVLEDKDAMLCGDQISELLSTCRHCKRLLIEKFKA